MKLADTAARVEIQAVAGQFRGGAWREAVGSSGTAKALGEICRLNGHSDGAITLDGLKWLRERLLKSGNAEQLEVAGLKADRKPVIAGGLAVMLALFQEFGIDAMTVAQGAMREGILWDLLGRVHDRDMRDVTVTQFQQRYRVDPPQARRVEETALSLLAGLPRAPGEDGEEAARRLAWAARLHEIGISIAHSGFHKHGAYILENADMPGFSRRDQTRLATLVRASRGGLGKLPLRLDDADWPLILCLRLAVLVNIGRNDVSPPLMRLACEGGVCELRMSPGWREANPLTQAALAEELAEWCELAPTTRLAAVVETP